MSPGTRVVYTVTLSNNAGSGNHAYPTSFVDTLPTGFTFDNTYTITLVGNSTASCSLVGTQSASWYDSTTNQVTVPMTGDIPNSKDCTLKFAAIANGTGTFKNPVMTWYMGYGAPGNAQSKTFTSVTGTTNAWDAPVTVSGATLTPTRTATATITTTATRTPTVTATPGGPTFTPTRTPTSTPTPQISVVKTSSPSTAYGDDRITYTVTVSIPSGAGSVTITNLVDVLPTGFTYVSGTTSVAGYGVQPDPSSSTSGGVQTLTFSGGGVSVPAGVSYVLTFNAQTNGTTGSAVNTATLNGTQNGNTYAVSDSDPGVTVNAAQQLWANAQACTTCTLNATAGSIDGAFNGTVGTTNSGQFGNGNHVWTFDFPSTTLTTVSGVAVTARFRAGAGYSNDMWALEFYDSSAATWRSLSTYGNGQTVDPAPTTLTTYTFDVSAYVTTAAEVNALQVRLRGTGKSGGADTYVMEVDGVLVDVDGH